MWEDFFKLTLYDKYINNIWGKGIMTNEDLIVKVTEHDSRLDSAEKRIDKLEAAQSEIKELTLLFKELSTTVKMLTSSMDGLNARMRTSELAPAEKYEKIKMIVITAFLTAVIGGAVAAVITIL